MAKARGFLGDCSYKNLYIPIIEMDYKIKENYSEYYLCTLYDNLYIDFITNPLFLIDEIVDMMLL